MVVPPHSPTAPPVPPTPPEVTKAAMRAELRAARDGFVLGLAPGERERLEARALAHLAPLLDGAPCVAFYIARGSELGCAAAMAAVEARGGALCLPYVADRAAPMRFLAWTTGDTLQSGWRGLLQPSPDAAERRPDIIVAPLLGFDAQGGRIGQGAGFYDRAFAALPAARRIGLGWSIQQRALIARDSWDVPLDAVVTEQGITEGKRAK